MSKVPQESVRLQSAPVAGLTRIGSRAGAPIPCLAVASLAGLSAFGATKVQLLGIQRFMGRSLAIGGISIAALLMPATLSAQNKSGNSLNSNIAQSGGVASGFYVVTNDGIPQPNTASVLRFHRPTGSFSVEKVLQTHGLGNHQSNIDAQQLVTISADGSCTFVADEDSSDIAAFASFKTKVGKYQSGELNAIVTGGYGWMTLAENNAGTILYATYGGSNNLAVWTINNNCSLTLENIFVLQNLGSYGGGLIGLTVAHDDSTLLGSYGQGIVNGNFQSYVESWAISGTTLEDNGAVQAITAWPAGVRPA